MGARVGRRDVGPIQTRSLGTEPERQEKERSRVVGLPVHPTRRMSFINRVVSWLANEVIVKTLSQSQGFQRAARRSVEVRSQSEISFPPLGVASASASFAR